MRRFEKQKTTIHTDDKRVKSILDYELFGQFSDGFWENSRNKGWQLMGKVVLDDKNGLEGPQWQVRELINNPYNVDNRELLKYIGARMTGFVAFADLLVEKNCYDLNIAVEYLSEIAWGTDGFEKRITTYKPVRVTTSMLPKLKEKLSYRDDKMVDSVIEVLFNYLKENEVILDVKELRETLKKTNKVLRTAL